MAFRLDYAFSCCYSDFHSGALSDSKCAEADWKKITRALNRWQEIFFDPEYLTGPGFEDLRTRRIRHLHLPHPDYEMRCIASLVHQAAYFMDQNDRLKEELDRIVSSDALKGKEFKTARSQIRLFSNHLPLLQRLSRNFLESDLRAEWGAPIQPYPEFELDPHFMDGVVRDVGELLDEAAEKWDNVRRKVFHFLRS